MKESKCKMVNFENTNIKEKKKKQIPSVYKEKIVN